MIQSQKKVFSIRVLPNLLEVASGTVFFLPVLLDNLRFVDQNAWILLVFVPPKCYSSAHLINKRIMKCVGSDEGV
jgi:hypothetical protein